MTPPRAPLLLLACAFLLAAARPGQGQAAPTTPGDPPGWFPFSPTNEDDAPSVIGMSDWLPKPAGARGRPRMDGERLVLPDGAPLKLWGVNNGSGNCAPPKEVGARRAARYEKYGINCVRLHKFVHRNHGGIGDREDSTKITADGWDRLDAYVAELKKRGIYHAWSAVYGHKVLPGDRKRLLAYDEVVNVLDGHLKGTTYGLVNFAPDLQDLLIDLTVGMLRHRNPYTGLTYAEEPALAFVEMHNEDDIFFPTTRNALRAAPTYKKLFCGLFSDWLKRKYGTHDKLVEAWGARAMDAFPDEMKGEHLDKRNVYPMAHFWHYGREGLEKEGARLGSPRRLLDTARFLYETQNAFYDRFARAIRDAGYDGPLVSSCWQAGGGVSHYYNLHADARIGIVDRHNYFGGGRGHALAPGPFDNRSMLARIGSGLLGTGLQAVAGRPFALSEWMSLMPNDWIAEGPPLVAIYGMGLQGWDASFAFASDGQAFTKTIQSYTVYNVDAPTQLPLYPALARMIQRGDVAEGAPLPMRKVHVPSLAEGALGFEEGVEQKGDVKGFFGHVPGEALAAGKVQVAFVDEAEPTPPFDLPARGRTTSGATTSVASDTGQLRWEADGERGFFTVDTPGTQGLVGAAPARPFRLGDVTVRVDSGFAVLLVTSLDRAAPIRRARTLLVTVVARARNTGMRLSPAGTELLDKGGPPILLEPVRASLAFKRKGRATVTLLDHDGRRTGRTRPLRGGRIAIDGRKDQAIYYEVRFE